MNNNNKKKKDIVNCLCVSRNIAILCDKHERDALQSKFLIYLTNWNVQRVNYFILIKI